MTARGVHQSAPPPPLSARVPWHAAPIARAKAVAVAVADGGHASDDLAANALAPVFRGLRGGLSMPSCTSCWCLAGPGWRGASCSGWSVEVMRARDDPGLWPADPALCGGVSVFPMRWLRVLGHAETPQIDERVGHQLHAIVPTLMVLETQQQPLEFVLPRKRPLDALP